jgi:hypothetical protein
LENICKPSESLAAVLLSVILTQLFKAVIPSPDGSGKWEVGPMVNRTLPFFPLGLGILMIIVKDVIIYPAGTTPMAYDDAIIKGMISGTAGAYLYRTAKVTLFGS